MIFIVIMDVDDGYDDSDDNDGDDGSMDEDNNDTDDESISY